MAGQTTRMLLAPISIQASTAILVLPRPGSSASNACSRFARNSVPLRWYSYTVVPEVNRGFNAARVRPMRAAEIAADEKAVVIDAAQPQFVARATCLRATAEWTRPKLVRGAPAAVHHHSI